MIVALKLVIALLLTFVALSVAYAMWIGLRREARPDLYAEPFGDVPHTIPSELPSDRKRAVGAVVSPPARPHAP